MHLLVYTAVKTSQNKLQAILRIYTNQNEIVWAVCVRQLFMAMSVLRTVFLCASAVYGNVRAKNCVSVCVSCLWQCPCWELCFCVRQLFMAMSVLGTVFLCASAVYGNVGAGNCVPWIFLCISSTQHCQQQSAAERRNPSRHAERSDYFRCHCLYYNQNIYLLTSHTYTCTYQ